MSAELPTRTAVNLTDDLPVRLPLRTYTRSMTGCVTKGTMRGLTGRTTARRIEGATGWQCASPYGRGYGLRDARPDGDGYGAAAGLWEPGALLGPQRATALPTARQPRGLHPPLPCIHAAVMTTRSGVAWLLRSSYIAAHPLRGPQASGAGKNTL